MQTSVKVTGIDATYYTVQDLEKLTKFYSDVLGAQPVVKMDFFAEWNFEDGSAFGLYKSEEPGKSRGGSAMFRVDDPHAAAKKLKELNAHSAHGDEDVGDFPTCYMVFGNDPEGNQFIIHKRKQ